METQRKTLELLGQIPRPGFLVRENRISAVNQAAQSLMLTPGQDFLPLLQTSKEDYAAFEDGQLCVTLTLAGNTHHAVLTRMDTEDLVLLDSREELEEFRSMSLVSMELRKPLMQAIASARQMESADPASAKMNQSLMQMLRLVGNMSDIGRYTACAQRELRDVDSFLLELFEKAKTLTEGRVRLSFEGLKCPIFSLIDPEQLERALWNILSNCIRFIPEGGTIAARLTRHGNFLHLTVEDSGSGIGEAVRADLFRRYLRQPGVEDFRYGLGLGLAIVRTAAANHGGTLLVRDRKEGGTRITMTLALRQDNGEILRSPLRRPDYAGGFDHGLVELSDCLRADHYSTL